MVGSGAGGLFAAVTAAWHGLNVIIVEKDPVCGGATAWSGKETIRVVALPRSTELCDSRGLRHPRLTIRTRPATLGGELTDRSISLASPAVDGTCDITGDGVGNGGRRSGDQLADRRLAKETR